MSAVEALAEVLAAHSHFSGNTGWWRCTCGTPLRGSATVSSDHLIHQAEAVVAAIRSMPAEQVAELIGGGRELRQVTNTPATWVDGFTNQERAVGPWTEMPTTASPAVLGLRKIEPEREQQ